MNVTDIRQLLADADIRLTKSLGQNFLHDANQLRRIVESGDLSETDSVLEIGPGLGPLTELLIPECRRLLAIEKDERLVQVLAKRFAGVDSLELVHEDALRFLRREKDRDWIDWKLIANLPYSVGSPILVELALSRRPPSMMVATLQMEVVQRIKAKPAGKIYGVLSLLIQLAYEPVSYFKVPAGCFYPRPNVASACIGLRRRAEALLTGDDVGRYVKLVKVGFGQRRKIMLKLLRNLWSESQLKPAYEEAGIDFQARAETVSVEQFVCLARCLGRPDTSSQEE